MIEAESLFVDIEQAPGQAALDEQKSPMELLNKLCAANHWGMIRYDVVQGPGGNYSFRINMYKLYGLEFVPVEHTWSSNMETARNLCAHNVVTVLNTMKNATLQ